VLARLGQSGSWATWREWFDLAAIVAVAAPLGGLAAFVLLRYADWGTPRDPRATGGGPELGVWQVLIAAQVIVWMLIASAGLRALAALNKEIDEVPSARAAARDGRWRRETVAFLLFTYGVLVLFLVLSGIAGMRNPNVMAGQGWKMPVLHVVAGVATLPFFVVLKRVQLWVTEDSAWSSTGKDVERVRLLRRQLRSATASLGAIIALAVVATGALRQAVEAASLEPLPETFVIVYGAGFTGVLAGVYLYVFGALDGRAREIVANGVRVPDPDPAAAEKFSARIELRRALAEELELGGDAKTNLEGLLVVLSPLVAAMLTRIGGL
jgi:hypothetical protein